MQINPLAGMGIAPNATYDSAKYMAGEAQFSRILKEAERKATQGYGAGHVVNSPDINQADKELKEACKGFESMFLDMMYRQMRKTVPESPMFGKSNAMSIFEDMRDTELMKQTAESGGIGLADLLYKQLAPSVLKQDALAQEQGITMK